ncbi:IS630 family transposase [Nocardia puris]|nr:IS630 family transposase [Nocardia puris]
MVHIGRPKNGELTVTATERRALLHRARAATSTQAYALRCRIVLACAEPGARNSHVAARLGVSAPTVAKWRERFIERGLAGLDDQPRSGRPKSIPPDRIRQVVTLTLEQVPADSRRWTRASMAARTGLSKSTIGRIWRRFGFAPHLAGWFKIPVAPPFLDNVVDIVGLYRNASEKAVVLCTDRESGGRMFAGARSSEPRTRERPRRTAGLVAVFGTGHRERLAESRRTRRAVEFTKFLASVDARVPAELDVHVVCNNYATNRTSIVQEWLAAHPRFRPHFTPAGISWLDRAERWMALLADQLVHCVSHGSGETVERDVRAWVERWKSDPLPIGWKKAAGEAIGSLAGYLQRFSTAERKHCASLR